MAIAETVARPKPKFVDKERIRKLLEEHDTRTGFVPVTNITAEELQARIAENLRARGIEPASLRYPQEEPDEDA